MNRGWTAVCCAVLVVSLAACGGAPKSEESGASPAASPEKVELRVAWWGGEARHKLWNETLDKFQEKYPHITLKREYTDINAFFDKLNTQMAAGSAPDVMTMARKRSSDYVQRGQLLPLDDLIASKAIDVSDFSQPVLDSGKLNGKTYMISIGTIASATFYNADLFKRVGVSPPRFDWTWDEFVAKVIELQEALKKNGITDVWATGDYGGDEYEFRAFFLGRGKDLFSPDGKLGFDRQDLIDWLSLWDKLRKAGVTPPPEVQAEYPSEIPEQGMFARGKVAMLMRPSNQFNANQQAMKDEIDLVRVPAGTDRTKGQDLDGTHISIYAKTKHPKEAALLINYLLNDPDSAKILKIEYGPVGSRKMNDLIKPLLKPAEVKSLEFVQKVSDIARTPNLSPTGGAEIVKQIKLANEAVAFKKKSVEQAVDDFFKEAERILK